MSWIVAILSVFLVLSCLLLMLLVLIQLPKKEAGMGQAFGGGATDALFGAGSGTALTKMTKYTTGIFFVLTLLLWILKAQEVKHSGSSTRLEKNMQELGKTERGANMAKPATPPTAAAPVTTTNATGTSAPANPMLLNTATNLPTKPATNAPLAEEPKK
jgi:protein translocase SecG subunit